MISKLCLLYRCIGAVPAEQTITCQQPRRKPATTSAYMDMQETNSIMDILVRAYFNVIHARANIQ